MVPEVYPKPPPDDLANGALTGSKRAIVHSGYRLKEGDDTPAQTETDERWNKARPAQASET